jgi:hypothetical protein
MSEDGREENRKQGGFKTMPFILGKVLFAFSQLVMNKL